MKKIQFLVILLLLLTVACTNQQKSKLSQCYDLEKSESFNVFFNRFKSNKDFQKLRIDCPLTLESIDDESAEINYSRSKKKIEYVSFDQKNWTDPISLSFRKLINDTIVVDLNGVETGLRVEHYFVLRKKVWFLCKIRDKSD